MAIHNTARNESVKQTFWRSVGTPNRALRDNHSSSNVAFHSATAAEDSQLVVQSTMGMPGRARASSPVTPLVALETAHHLHERRHNRTAGSTASNGEAARLVVIPIGTYPVVVAALVGWVVPGERQRRVRAHWTLLAWPMRSPMWTAVFRQQGHWSLAQPWPAWRRVTHRWPSGAPTRFCCQAERTRNPTSQRRPAR
jgi:hypothetical protein